MELLATKLGMTRLFDKDGGGRAVTVLAAAGNRVAQIKNAARDGYSAVQVAYGERRRGRLSRALAGHLAKHEAGSAAHLHESRVAEAEAESLKAGGALSAELFAEGQAVDVQGISKGKGFAGVIKRHHFSSNRASHGNSRAHRKPGSTGQCQDPGRVFPGKKMAGRLGGKRRTAQNLSVARIDAERNLVYVAGAVPGANGGLVILKPAAKGKGQSQQQAKS